MSLAVEYPEPEPQSVPVKSAPVDMAALLAARLCHDFISPTSAIVSGLDLLEDPTAQDMRDDAMSLITSSAHKLADMLQFARVAFGAASASEVFDTRELEKLASGVFGHVRADLDWRVEIDQLPRTPARALLNLAQLGSYALPSGGVAQVRVACPPGGVAISVEATGIRPRMKPETLAGLRGEPFGDGLVGQWVQGAYLHQIVTAADGKLAVEVAEDKITFAAWLPV